MAYNYDETVTVGNGIKQEYVKIVKLTFADFKTGGQTSTKEVLPGDATIVRVDYWKKTAFSGGSVSAVTLGLTQSNTGTAFATGFDVHTPAAGSSGTISPLTNIFQAPQVPTPVDIPINFVGTATTGNPTAGELYVVIKYVR